MRKDQRQQKILDLMYSSGSVSVADLVETFHCSFDTVRRDLNELETQGVVRRVYGGAVPAKEPIMSAEQRRPLEHDSKLQVARKALTVLKPESLIAIDAGTTNTVFASLIPLSMKLRVVTNGFSVAEELRKHPGIQVIFLGGVYNKGSLATVGSTALQQLTGFHFDQCFLGAYAVDATLGISVPHPYEDEACVKRQIVAASDEVYVMCTQSKLDKMSNYVICGIDQVTRVLCPDPFAPDLKARYGNKIL